MNTAEKHTVECDANWKHQEETNKRHEGQLAEVFQRLNKLEVRFAGLAAIGGFIGSIVGKLF